MADPFVAEIRIFPFNFAPKGWAWCNGQLLPLSQNTALFSLLGTTYGGDGRSTFALPDLQGRAPMHSGQGPGLTNRDLGEQGGVETVTLLESEMPLHAHNVTACTQAADSKDPSGKLPAKAESAIYRSVGGPPTGSGMLSVQPHNNMQPYLTFYFCIALQGVFPARP